MYLCDKNIWASRLKHKALGIFSTLVENETEKQQKHPQKCVTVAMLCLSDWRVISVCDVLFQVTVRGAPLSVICCVGEALPAGVFLTPHTL